jgi:gliding motility-associated-like protein
MTFSSTPLANSTSVSVTSNIALDFSADVDLGTVHSNTLNADDVFDDNIKIIGSQSGQFRGVFSVGADNSIVIFNPSTSFKAGEKVTVIVNALVLSTIAQPATPSSYSFLAQAGPFEGGFRERPTAGITGVADGTFDWGDYDNDGDLDLIVVGFDPSYNAQATIYNNVNGVFTDIAAGLTGVYFSSAEWGDYDNDGDLDVVVAGVDDSGTTRSTTIYRNDGGGVFVDIVAGLQGVDYSDLDWGDYDNDGDLDLVVMGRYFKSAFFGGDLASSTIYRNDGSDIFTDIGAGLQPLNNGSMNWGDYDADGDLDLVMNGYDGAWSNRYTIIYDNNNGIFTDHLAGLPDVSWGDSDWGDYDNDGDLDLLLSGGAVGPSITSIYNNTGGVFTDINAGLPLVPEGSVRWGDYDGDGNLDVVLTGTDSFGDEITHIYKNSGGGVFTDIHAGLATVYFRGLADFVDFDGDGDLDILVAGESTIDPTSTSAILYENTVFNAFITTWKTDNSGSSNDNQITIPTTGSGYFYTINWGDGMTDTDVTGDITHTYATPGTYTVSISGAFPRIYFNAGGFFGANNDHEKILTVEQWGDVAWTSMSRAFSGCENLRINAVDAPDLSGVTDMSQMFYDATSFNDNINHWNVSTITNMSQLFREAQAFNQDIGSWNVDMVTSMSSMFEGAASFNQNLNGWNVDAVTSMSNMFYSATAFNGDVSNWHVDNLTSFRFMFLGAQAFNQDISGWQINTSSNVSLEGMFAGATSFNQDISFKPGGGNNGGDAWNTSMVTNMRSTFSGTIAFTQPIVNWNVANVTTMERMFSGNTTFNQDISGWSVDNVRNMEDMFSGASSFNQDISSWNVSMVDNMRGMFLDATSFNQDIGRVGGWDVSGVSEMRLMFQNASSFDQNLGGWDFSSLSGNSLFNFLNNSGLSVTNYDNLLIGLEAQIGSLNPSISNFGAQNIYYCAGESARTALMAFGWTFNDAGSKCITLFNGPDTTAPEIANAQPEAIDYGSTSTTKSKTFTLLNNQSFPITNVQINNSSPGFPAAVVFASIAAGATQTFTVDLTGGIGTYTETVTITSDDFSGSFQFDVTGEVTAIPEPEIAVFEGPDVLGTPILDGQLTPLDLGYQIKGNSLMGEFTITNIGDAVLNISDITFTGSAFVLGSIPPATVPVNGTETIQVILSGISAGIFFETISILNDDTDEAIFNFNVYGEIIGPDIAVYDGTDIYSDPEILDGQAAPVDFGSGPNGVDIILPITIANLNPADLNISNITITGSAFTLTSTPPTFVAAEVDGIISFVTFDIMLSGASGGSFNETVTIFSDDEDEPAFNFTLAGTITTTACASVPTAAVGTIADICENGTIQLSGSFGGAATSASWSTPGDGSFDNAALLNAVYTPGTSDMASGSVNFTLTTNDPDGAGPCVAASAVTTVAITSAPIAGSPAVQSNVALASNINVIGASTVAPGDVITVTILQNPIKGTVIINNDNSIDYTATSGTIGADSFDYEICNQCGLCSTGSVSIDILNQPPVFTAPTTPPPILPGQVITLLITDYLTDPNNNIDLASLTNLTTTGNGIVSYDGNGIITLDYTNATFSGNTENISFRIFDTSLAFIDVTIAINVIGEIIAYTGISPNNDGLNDFFLIQNIQFLEPNNKVTIYNRWGDKVFEMDNYDSASADRRFEGKQNSGKELPSGVYFYKVEFATGRPGLNGYLTLKN